MNGDGSMAAVYTPSMERHLTMTRITTGETLVIILLTIPATACRTMLTLNHGTTCLATELIRTYVSKNGIGR